LTSLLIGHALTTAARLRPEVPGSRLDLQLLGEVAFGRSGQRLIAVLFALELWFALETFILLTSINVNLLTGAPRTLVIVIAGALGTLSLSLPMSVISSFSGMSVWCMLGGLVALIVCGSMASFGPELSVEEHMLVDVRALPSAMAIFLYCFSGLPCLPNIRAAMQKTEEYSYCVNTAFVFAVIYYAVVGILGYYFFAGTTRESFTENLVPYAGMPHGSIFSLFSLVSAALFAVKLQAGFPLYAAPVLQTLGACSTHGASTQTIAVARCAFAAVSICFAIFAKDALDGVAELMGAFLTMSTSVLFPVAAYASVRTIAGERLAWWEVFGLGSIFLGGIIFGALGTYDAIRRIWVEEKQAGYF